MKSTLIHKSFSFSNTWRFLMWNYSCLLKFLDLIIIGFLAHAKSLITQPLETRLSIPSICSQEPSWTHINFAIIMKIISFILAWSSNITCNSYDNFSNIWDYAYAYNLVSFSIPWLVILSTTYFNKLHLDMGVNSSPITHIPIHTILIACYHSHTRSCCGIHLVIWVLSWTLIHFIAYIPNMIINFCSYTQQDG